MAPALGVIRLAGYINQNGHHAEHFESLSCFLNFIIFFHYEILINFNDVKKNLDQ